MSSLSAETIRAKGFQKAPTPSLEVEDEESNSTLRLATPHAKIAIESQEPLGRHLSRAASHVKAQAITNTCHAMIAAFVHDFAFLYRLIRHPKTPGYAKGLLFLPVAYVCSPIQLIPNFIPVFGQMDDVFVIWMTKRFMRKLVDQKIWQECEDAARACEVYSLKQLTRIAKR